jgi:hypothetical protein
MQLLFRLPFLLLETFLRRGLTGVAALVQVFRGGGEEDVVTPVAPPAAEPPAPRSYTGPPRPAPPTADEAIERRFEREAAAASAAPVPAVTPVVPEPPAPTPLRPEPAAGGHVDREATMVESFGPASDVGGVVIVEAPWDGYDAMPATAIVARLRGSDLATKGVARLYEQNNKNRATVVRACG